MPAKQSDNSAVQPPGEDAGLALLEAIDQALECLRGELNGLPRHRGQLIEEVIFQSRLAELNLQLQSLASRQKGVEASSIHRRGEKAARRAGRKALALKLMQDEVDGLPAESLQEHAASC